MAYGRIGSMGPEWMEGPMKGSKNQPVRSNGLRKATHHFTAQIGAVVLLCCLAAGSARAELRVCNATPSRVGVALGYQGTTGWMTEGWWNIAAQTCESVLKSAIPSRFLYVYAIDYERGGEWAGSHLMCTTNKTFAIRDVKRCRERGFGQNKFFEVDTGDASTWTIRLSDPEEGETKSK